MQTLTTEVVPPFVKHMAVALKSNGGQWLVGSDLTWADINLAWMLHNMSNKFSADWEKAAPELAAYSKKVLAQPKIKHYLETRPKAEERS